MLDEVLYRHILFSSKEIEDIQPENPNRFMIEGFPDLYRMNINKPNRDCHYIV